MQKHLPQFKKPTLEEIRAAHELKPSLWVKGMVNESGLPIEFHNHRFLIDIFNDLSPLQVILKAPQVGMTTTSVLKALYIASHYNKQIIYTLPTATDMYEMVGGGFNRIINQNAELKELVKDSDTMEHKQVGGGLVRFRGTFSAKQAMMVPSDLNIHDETDASDPNVIVQYETRLQAKADGMRWYFSHPSLAGHGVDVYWSKSDKKEWFITCPNCKHEQILEWPDNISRERELYICKSCKGEITNANRRAGEWRATATGIFSGYHISQLICPWISAKTIIEAKEDPLKTEQYFYNYVLGLPYLSSDDKIEPATVLRNCVPEVNDQTDRVIIGVDTGLPVYFTCINKQGVFYYGKCKRVGDEGVPQNYDPYNDIEKLLKRWPNSIIVSDQGGDLTPMRLMQQKYPGRVFLCYYQRDRKSTEVIQWGTGDDYNIVKVDRNAMIQIVIEEFRDIGRVRLNGEKTDWEDFAAHFGNIHREKVEVRDLRGKDDRSLYGNEYVWKRTGPDHWVHAYLYARVGLSKFQEASATIMGGDFLEGIPMGRIFD